MHVLKRLLNIVQADINAFLDKIEKRHSSHRNNKGSSENGYKWDNFKSDNYKSSGYSKTNYSKSQSHDDKLAAYYANLEVPYGSDLNTVKAAWKRLLKKCHPDLYANDPHKKEIATKLASKLNEAYREIEKSYRK